MKLTPDSNKLLKFFSKHHCLPHINQINATDNVFKKLFNEIDTATKYILHEKERLGHQMFYKLVKTYIHDSKKIPKPSTFPADSFPNLVRNHIDKNSLCSLTYSFQLFNKPITIIFLVEEHDKTEKYNKYVDNILTWLHIVLQYASPRCVAKLSVYIYLTSLTKELPKTQMEILNQHHVNTAFTYSCPKDAEIVVFRKEEWFKVFMHETFHNFALDFSDMNNSGCHAKILEIFPVRSDVNLFEAYTEFWARIMNVVFCSYLNTKCKKGLKEKDIDEFLDNVEMFINFEIMYSFFQMIKVLHFMNLEYKHLWEHSVNADKMRNALYKEDTNVLSYYVITLILIYNYQPFLSWCHHHNKSLLQFNKTSESQMEFCHFIDRKYKSPNLLHGIKCVTELFQKIKVVKHKSKSHSNSKANRGKMNSKKDIEYLYNNLRMTLCELG
jgi:hypothetical protein